MTSLAAMATGGSAYTPEYTFVRGEFALGTERLPYFSTAMSLRDCARYLSLARDLVFDVDTPVNFDELFQRELSKPRARGPIVDYLKQPHRLKFFNAFTVVLVPVQAGGRPVPLAQFPPPDGSPFAATTDDMTNIATGGVQLRQLRDGDVGFIRWNPDTTQAVVIDGQHRFFALKELLDDDHYSGALAQDTTRIPVLLLVLDSAVGYESPDGQPSLLAASRIIFTDLNKNAVALTRTREYLLDDLDLTSVCMRALLTKQIGGTANATAGVLPLLPLATVDWYSEQAKFDSGLHLTTVLTLHELVRTTINRPAPRPTDYSELDLWASELHSRFDLDEAPEWDLSRIRSRLAENEVEQLPFALDRSDLTCLARAYAADLGRLVTVPLTGLTPYAELRRAYHDAGLLGGRDELWLGHDVDGKAAFEKQTGRHPYATAAAAAAAVKGRFDVAYQVVFQKALIASVRDLDGCRDDVVRAWIEPDSAFDERAETDRAAFLSYWLQRINQRLDPVYDSAFWIGAARSSTGRVDYTQRGVSGLTGLLVLTVLAPLEEWPTGPARAQVDEQATFEAFRAKGHPGTAASLLAGDPLEPPRKTSIGLSAIRWWTEQLSTIRPGPAGALSTAVRTAARQYRTSLRQYIADLARSTNIELTEQERDDLVIAVGARRFAALHAGIG